MARIAINDIQESESFLTELNDTDVAMEQINGGGFFFPFFRFFRRRSISVNVTPTATTTPTITFPRFTFTFGGN